MRKEGSSISGEGKMYSARLTESVLLTEVGETVKTYGIEVASGGDMVKISDISADKKLVEKIVKRCRECYVSAIHLADVVEDMLHCVKAKREVC